MAQGYARATQRPGVVLVTSGPGTSHMVTPVFAAAMDSTPLLVFCGQVPQQAIDTNAFQNDPNRTDHTAVRRGLLSRHLRDGSAFDLGGGVSDRRAGSTGSGGGGHPEEYLDCFSGRTEVRCTVMMSLPLAAERGVWEGTTGTPGITDEQIATIAEMRNQSERPLIHAGQGVVISSRRAEMVNELALSAKSPVATTLFVLGCFNDEDPKSLGMVGQYDSAAANLAVQEADLLLVFGARLDDRVVRDSNMFALKARTSLLAERLGLVQIHIHKAHLNQVIPAREAVACDVGDAIFRVLPHVHSRSSRPGWMGQQLTWKKLYPFKYAQHDGGPIMPQAVLEELDRQLQGQSKPVIVTTGSGSTKCGPRNTSSGIGSARSLPRAPWTQWASAFQGHWGQ
ncbi:DHS-like NAD/FAD-binding domain-containing protein, partial [Aspergillus japonicus CBS 114.51]